VSKRLVLLLVLAALLSGCASLMRSATEPLADSLRIGIENQTDPEIARSGLPAYLMLLDGLIAKSPNDANLLATAAKLYGAYSALVADEARQQTLAATAFGYAERAVCLNLKPLCQAPQQPFDQLTGRIAKLDQPALGLAFVYASAWAALIQADSGNFDNIAAVPKVSALIERILALDPKAERGMPELYLGVLNALLPSAYGGKPELARAHFERAIALSDGQNLMAKTLYAQFYARLVFNQELHDRLLDEVIIAPAAAPGFGLSNALAKSRALELRESGKDYF